ncbi:MAG: thrombospondin type 3 repeat-containing protein [Solirubrobacterales bacterium]
MTGRTLRTVVVALGVALTGLVAASSAAAATSLYHPTEASRTFNAPPATHGWTATTEQDFALCIPPVTCPTVTNSTPAAGGSGGGVGNRFIRTHISGLTSVATTTTSTWTSPNFTYLGAGGQQPAIVTFTMDRRVDAGALLQLLTSEDYSVFLDNVTTGISLTVVDHAPIFNQPDWASIAAVSVSPNQLTIGNTYRLRIVTRLGIPVAVLPDGDFDYDNVVLAASTATPPDRDGDGVPDDEDNCPGVANPPQGDLDMDGIGNACDPDIDGDGVPNGQENPAGCPTDSSPTNPDSDNDGVNDGQDAFPCDPNESNDADHDGVGDGGDNCPTVSNANQADLDGDHVGDACDTDIDGDGVPNGQENPAGCPAGSSPTDPDSDNDGVNDGQDAFPCDPTRSAAGGGGGAGGALGQQGTGGKNTVRFKARCPRDAEFARCLVRASGRLGKFGPRITPVFKTKVGQGKIKFIHLTIAPQFQTQANAAGRLIVVRIVKEGPGDVTKRFLSRPLL